MRLLTALFSAISRIFRSTLVVLLTLTPVSGSTPGAGRPDLSGITNSLERSIERILDETGIPSISVALVRDGEVAWADARGYANLGARVPATADTYYNTGSTFKFVTATAIMQLVEKGAFTLETPLNQIEGLDLQIKGGDDVTVRHLLSHRSGLDAYATARRFKTAGSVSAVPLWSWQAHIATEELLSHTRPADSPGKRFKYSNDGYVIAGYIVEKVSGQSYDEYVAQHVLQPLGIDIERPSVPSPRVVEHMALPYELTDNTARAIPQVRFDAGAPGDVYLKASDMARFVAAQLNGGDYAGERILSADSTEEMRRQHFEGRAYGLGVGMTHVDGHDLITHSGGIPGFKSIMVAEPSTRNGVYIMANAGASGATPQALGMLAHRAMQLMRGDEPAPIPSFAPRLAITLSPEILDHYVGEYVIPPGRSFIFLRTDDRFFVRVGNRPPVEVFASSETDFFLREGRASVTFGRDVEGGPVTHLIHHAGQGDQRANRLNEHMEGPK